MNKFIFLFGFLFVIGAFADGDKCAYLFEVKPVSREEGPIQKRDHWDSYLAYLEIYERTGQPTRGEFNPILIDQLISENPTSPWVHQLLTLSDMAKKIDEPSAHDPELTNREILIRDYIELRMRKLAVSDQTLETYKVAKSDSDEVVTEQRIYDILRRSGTPKFGLYDSILLQMNLEQHKLESKDWPEKAKALSAATQAIESVLKRLDNSNEEARKSLQREFLQLRERLGL